MNRRSEADPAYTKTRRPERDIFGTPQRWLTRRKLSRKQTFVSPVETPQLAEASLFEGTRALRERLDDLHARTRIDDRPGVKREMGYIIWQLGQR